MSWFDKRIIAVPLAALMLAGCELRPAADADPLDMLGAIEVSVPGNRKEFLLEGLLVTGLGGPSGNPEYLLTVNLSTGDRKAGIKGHGGLDRIALEGEAAYELIRSIDGETVASGVVTGSASFSNVGMAGQDASARRDAEDRLMAVIADRLRTRLLITSGEWMQ